MRRLLVIGLSIIMLMVSMALIWRVGWHRASTNEAQGQVGPFRATITNVEREALSQGIILVQSSDNPITVTHVSLDSQHEREGDVKIQIKNISDKAVRALSYWLVAMPCRQQTASLLLDYGDRQLLDKRSSN